MKYQFDEYLLDSDRPTIFLDGREQPLEPQVFRLLLYLLEARDRIVSKDELIESVWDARVVSDATLNTGIRSVRRVLGDDRDQQKYIRTYPKRGFQFVGTLRHNNDCNSETTSQKPLFRLQQHLKLTRLHIVIVAALVATVMSFGWWSNIDTTTNLGLALPDKPSVAVLRFDNLSNDPKQAYFVDGLVEDLITGLSLNRELFVISSESTFTYSNKSIATRQIGKELGVAYIVRGSIRQTEKQVRVNAELVDAPSGNIVWSERFDRTQTNTFALQDEISQIIAGRLVPEIVRARVNEIRDRPTSSFDAWDYYLQAKDIQSDFTSANQVEAIHLAETAIEHDSEFAAPYALISLAKGVQYFHQWTSTNPEQLLADAIHNARTAIRLDGHDAAAYAALGYAYRLTGDKSRAIDYLERARQLNPNDANIRLELAHTLDWFREHDRALPEVLKAIRLSPRDPRLELMYFYEAHIRFHLGDHEGSLAASREMSGTLTNDTWRTFYHLVRAANFAYLQKRDDAYNEIASARKLNPKLSLASIKRRFAKSNNHPENRRIWLDALEKAGLPQSAT